MYSLELMIFLFNKNVVRLENTVPQFDMSMRITTLKSRYVHLIRIYVPSFLIKTGHLYSKKGRALHKGRWRQQHPPSY